MPGYTQTFGNLPLSSSIVANGYSASVQAQQRLQFSTPEYLIFPLVDHDESPLGRAYLDFQSLGRCLLATGTSPSQVVDQGLIDVTLFFRDRLPQDPLNASTWTSEMLKSFRGTLSDQLLLACAVGVAPLMRWLLMPTPDNYRNIPPMVRPTSMQRLRPHPAWVDMMVFPTFRDSLINNLRDWVEPCIKAKWTILWPHSIEDALLRDAASNRVFVIPEFASFVVNPNNWSMHKSILDDFPEVQGSEINIAQD